jgi:hypothetical protein
MAPAGVFLNLIVFCLMVPSFGQASIWVTWPSNGSVCLHERTTLRCNYDQKVLNTNGHPPDWIINGHTVIFPSTGLSRLNLVELELWLTTSQPIDVSCFVLTYDGANRISGSVTSEIVTVSPKGMILISCTVTVIL